MFRGKLRPALTLLIMACSSPPVVHSPDFGLGEEPEVVPPQAVLRRLTQAQYLNSLADVLTPDVLLPSRLEPDIVEDRLISIGASISAISPLGVERYEDAAFLMTDQVFEPGPIRDALVLCAPTDIVDDACARATLSDLGRSAWRRPLTASELDIVTTVANDAANTLEDFYQGLSFGVVMLLQSPNFLYRIELGEPDPNNPGAWRYSDYEMASRLSYLLWNTTPGAKLLEAAAAGELTQEDTLVEHIDRMLEDDRARRGFRNFITEMLDLQALDGLSKDTTVFPAMSAALGPAAREETLKTVEALVFDRDEDFRNWLTTRKTFIDPNLAMIYNVQAPSQAGHALTELPMDQARLGLLGQFAVLARYAHPVSTSATTRGRFVREVLLCEEVPDPPADVDTSIPEPSPDAPTRRERVAAHLDNAFCAGCHAFTDPIGLALENFDGLGVYRTTENGSNIDASGDLDGVPFTDAVGLAIALREHPGLTPCMSETLYAYAVGHRPELQELAAVSWMHGRFIEEDYSMKALLREVAISQTFRAVGAQQ
ncbi:MAG: DUF1592 domain-containing protein [Rhodobacterales bacterium]|nr:DUF1592 domain-containing protein [Rhodobacterales bacterium]